MKVFGISIGGFSLEKLFQSLKSASNSLWIVTANPEILLEARQDVYYAQALKQADIRLVDGAGLYFLGRIFKQDWSRVTGVECSEALIEYAAKQQWRVAFIGGNGVVQKCVEYWQRRYPELVLHGEEGGHVQKDGLDDDKGEEARHRLTLFAPQVVLVAFGHPKQERWIARYLQDFLQLRVIMGVGGTFDYWAGRIPRAPVWMQSIGLEWLWRLFMEPKRINRILRAVLLFPVLALWDAFVSTRS